MQGRRLRPLLGLFRLVAREAWCLMLTQPVRPLFRLVRRFRGPSWGERPVIFVHGYAQNCATFWWMALALARRKLGPLYAFNYWCFRDVRHIADELAEEVERICREHACDSVDLVCHSMGGIVALEYARRAGCARVRRVVTIATPHGGIAFKGPMPGACGAQLRRGCDYLAELARRPCSAEVLNIYSEHDTLFFEPCHAALQVPAGRDVAVRGHGHLSLLFDDSIADHIRDFLSARTGRALTPAPLEPSYLLAEAAE